ncbi:MAG: D-aminoacyl-tRNA deacylase [Bacteroidales bacterium]|jgi:D-tyrosyl-tRNA(Tyr) deacylase|nr:D-aminoacyl-tRNA deacylase [Bacteroidales bacterium]MDD2570479.1 D-aminoacyl-tRNA deacylase [Bacteroidales bacterium]MDD2813135.1 D-aminoacyl-tRNA deacylase [Bacteroidales bacterium]MDD3384255.1 D-aminoacyl-tRNA deacylase [Bacteroidales bacterium]MDD3811321.1 D-aminoacyl-tRNA deacylase [Bacteroidales bacterium]
MRALVQRVKEASVTISGVQRASVGQGLLVLIGIEASDDQEDIQWLANKIVGLRVFDDEFGVMNLSVKDIKGEILAVSQFTLHARIKKGFRPSYIDAAPPAISVPIYEQFVIQLEKELGKPIPTGEFGAMMDVALINDGPVTIWIDSKNRI